LGVIKQYTYFWPFEQERVISLYCTEDDVVNFSTSRGVLYSQDNLEDGTFYCYNKNNYLNTLELDKKDKVTLQLSSHQALYPGNYSMSVELMEVEPDNMPPQISLNVDKTIFGENDTIEVWLNVSDMYNIDYVEYEIVNPEGSDFNYNSGWIGAELNDEGFYYGNFNMSENDLNKSGSYWIGARACDVLGNCGTLW